MMMGRIDSILFTKKMDECYRSAVIDSFVHIEGKRNHLQWKHLNHNMIRESVNGSIMIVATDFFTMIRRKFAPINRCLCFLTILIDEERMLPNGSSMAQWFKSHDENTKGASHDHLKQNHPINRHRFATILSRWSCQTRWFRFFLSEDNEWILP